MFFSSHFLVFPPPIMQLAGAAILGVGIWVKVDSASLLGILDNIEGTSGLSQIVYVSYVLMVVGSVLLVIGFLGCCGAMKESKCMLLTVSDVQEVKAKDFV